MKQYRLACAVLVWLFASTAALTAQQPAPEDGRPRGGIAGSVLDAATGAPLEGATVVLQPEVVGAFPAGPASGSAFAAAVRAVLSDARGEYRFDALASGVYRVYVSRYGYRPYSVVVELRGAAMSPIAIALTAEPIPLQPIRSRAYARGPYESADAFGAGVDVARLIATEQRRHQFLTTDARELTHADVIEAVTLGEPDVLRALQRLPGVSTRSDYTAELWTRGAPWSHTRVYFDAIPLFHPLHALGIVSGIGSHAIGALWYHPGTRSAGMAEGAAGIIDLQTRRASGNGELNVHGDLSLVSAALALDQRVHEGRAGWMLSGRQTYLDWLTGLARRATNRDDDSFPYGFSEVAGRADVWVGDASVLEASWLWERDHLASTQPHEPKSMRAEWGNALGRLSFTTKLGGLHIRHTAGSSAHRADVLPDFGDALQADAPALGVSGSAAVVTHGASAGGVRYRGLTGTAWPEPATVAGPAWSVGYAIERYGVDYYGPQPLPVPRLTVARAESTSPLSERVRSRWDATLPVVAAWGERTWNIADRLGVRGGLRVEASDRLANAGALRFSPRLAARYTASPEIALSAGFARVYQYTQAVAPGGIYLASLASTDVWLVAGPDVPAVKSDIVTAGIETWLAPGRVVTLNGFGRRATGITAPDPRPGSVYDRPAFVGGRNTAYGVELSVRQITGRVTGSASYTLSSSDMSAAGMEYRAAADRPHVLSTTLHVRATDALRTGAAFTAATGVPFTRTVATAQECALVPGCDATKLPWMSEPHAERAPAFASLDLLLDYTVRLGSVELGAYAQLRNALGRDNATVYTGDQSGCTAVGCGGDLRSLYERGVPRLPVVGLRVRR